MLNAKASREEFNYCADELRKSMGSLTCLIVGKAKLDKDKLGIITEHAASKYSDSKKIDSKSRPLSLSTPMGETEFPTLKAKGMAAPLVADFMDYAVKERVAVNSGEVIVYKEKWEKKMDKKKVDSWVKSRYGKLGNLTSSLILLAISDCNINPSEAIAFSKNESTSKSVADLIKSAF